MKFWEYVGFRGISPPAFVEKKEINGNAVLAVVIEEK
jgi:hypothetical protein